MKYRAELRAAREVVEAERTLKRLKDEWGSGRAGWLAEWNAALDVLDAALAKYDRLTTSEDNG